MIARQDAIGAISGLPVGDWQFWVVSVLALGGVVLVLRPLLKTARSPVPPCSGCRGSGGRARTASGSPANLTIGGEIPGGRTPPRSDLR